MPNQRRSIPIPSEHGAWAILYGSIVLASLVAFEISIAWILVLISMTGLFLAHNPFSKLIRSTGRTAADIKHHWIRWLLIFLIICLVPGFLLIFFYQRWFLVPIGASTAVLLSIHLYWASKRKERTLSGELLGVIALTSAAFATYYVMTDQLSLTTGMIWLLSALYFASGVFYVRMRVSRFLKKDQFDSRRIVCLVYHGLVVVTLVILVIWGYIPKVLPIAYFPILARTLWYAWKSEDKLDIKRIGYSEVGQTVIFLILFSILWHI